MLNALAGSNLVLTRTPEDCAAWEGPLVAAGATVTRLPCIRTEVADDEATRASLRVAIADADWLILTSRRGVDALALLVPGIRIRARTRVAVVGKATAVRAKAVVGRVDLVGTGGTATRLAAEIAEDSAFAPGQHCVAVIAANAGPVLERTLGSAGGRCTRIDAYRTIPHPPVDPKRPLSALDADAIVFSSPTTVVGFLNQIELDCEYRAYSIGPSTSLGLREAGMHVTGEAEEPSIEGIIAIIERTLAGSPGI